VVTDDSGAALFEMRPMSFADALRAALSQDPEVSHANL
jgi:hypothetical protein